MKILPTYLPTYLLASAAMLALVFAAPANACQLVCATTTAAYPGNLGGNGTLADGLAKADAKCALEFPGFKFIRSSSILANLGDALPLLLNSDFGARVNAIPGYAANCQHWSSSAASETSSMVSASKTALASYFPEEVPISAGANSAVLWRGDTCNVSRQLICCNM